jgi:hypothetical protein
VPKHIGLPICGRPLFGTMCLGSSFKMKMSNLGTFKAWNNSITATYKEDGVCSTEKNYSFNTYRSVPFDRSGRKRPRKAIGLLRDPSVTFEPQVGFELSKLRSLVSDLAKFANIDYTDELFI